MMVKQFLSNKFREKLIGRILTKNNLSFNMVGKELIQFKQHHFKNLSYLSILLLNANYLDTLTKIYFGFKLTVRCRRRQILSILLRKKQGYVHKLCSNIKITVTFKKVFLIYFIAIIYRKSFNMTFLNY